MEKHGFAGPAPSRHSTKRPTGHARQDAERIVCVQDGHAYTFSGAQLPVFVNAKAGRFAELARHLVPGPPTSACGRSFWLPWLRAGACGHRGPGRSDTPEQIVTQLAERSVLGDDGAIGIAAFTPYGRSSPAL
ncbi:hypothetical protein MOV08_00875 [Streptomyces yunnanensis]|uniref:Uncharacterized protein n=1 Tax=Streptomyces yunnanensis TaxID=156453 RepID=A0ABY8AR57_9ACTN|nr:hypothetical protein [Streptomyces yunnanensis]WEB46121.1 hypothetical protein MOV08_00875 [Streptomyces yunnanensis]